MTKLIPGYNTTRRSLLKSISAAGVITLAAPGLVRAQAEPIRIGTLTPLTGSGGPYGPTMAQTVKSVVEKVNAAGGVIGRQLVVVSEDDQTNPEAAVRAARKLIDIDRVSAIIGTWASAVTTAVAPICWEGGTFITTTSGADSITQLPHKGYLIRTQPTTSLQGQKFGEFCLELGAKKVFFLTPQTPFADSQFATLKIAVTKGGGEAERLIYDDKKSSLRSELDQALRFKPDVIVLGGYTPDTTVLLRDIYRAGYSGKLLGFGYSVNQQLVEALPREVVEGIYTLSASPSASSTAYSKLASLIGVSNPDTYSSQVYDQTNLVLMAMQAANSTRGDVIKDVVRKISQGGGKTIDNAIEGIAAIKAGEKVDYEGASGPCDFSDSGDILDCKLRYEQVAEGKIKLLRIA